MKNLPLPLIVISFQWALIAQSPILVKDANPDLQPVQCSAIGSGVYFAAWENGTWQPWKSDGTDAGTQRIKTITGGSAGFDHFTPMNGIAYFYATDSQHGKELWRTDGTPTGTYLVKDIKPGSSDGVGFARMTVFNNKLYFAANDGQHGMELWATDGTEAGTYMVADIQIGASESLPTDFVELNGQLFFSAVGISSWPSPGGGTISINGSREIFKTDGTAQGTLPINLPIRTDAYHDVGDLIAFQGALYFVAEKLDFQTGFELWKTDGNPANTTMVKDIFPGTNSGVNNYAALANTSGYLFFPANNGVAGTELWRSDGTANGTQLVADLVPGISSSSIHLLAATSGVVFFTADQKLYASNGILQGTQYLLHPVPYDLIVANDVLYYSAKDNNGSWAIWTSDGSVAGTVLFADVDGNLVQTYGPKSFAFAGDRLFFNANDGLHGYELWMIDLNPSDVRLVEKASLSAYPNPAIDQVFIQLPVTAQQGLLRAFDISGRLLFQDQGDISAASPLQITVSGWPSGIYHLQFTTTSGEVFSGKIMRR